jgi:hypothetical protein
MRRCREKTEGGLDQVQGERGREHSGCYLGEKIIAVTTTCAAANANELRLPGG